MGRTTRRPGRSRRLATVVLGSLPGLIAIGVLLPGLVSVTAQILEDDGSGQTPSSPPTEERRERLVRELHELPVPRELGIGFHGGALDVEALFRAAARAGDAGAAFAERLLTFPHNTGDVIAADEVERAPAKVEFRDFVLDFPLVAGSDGRVPGGLDISDPLGDFPDDGITLDEPLAPFIGPEGELPPAVPEPGTGALALLGLAGIAGWRRRYRHPITS